VDYSIADGESVENPLLYYRADENGFEGDPSSLKQYDVGLALLVQAKSDREYFSYEALYSEQRFAPEDPHNPICAESCIVQPQETAVYLWNDFGQILRTAPNQVRNREDLSLVMNPVTGVCAEN